MQSAALRVAERQQAMLAGRTLSDRRGQMLGEVFGYFLPKKVTRNARRHGLIDREMDISSYFSKTSSVI